MTAAHPEALIALFKISASLSVLFICVGLAIALAEWLESRWPQRNRRL